MVGGRIGQVIIGVETFNMADKLMGLKGESLAVGFVLISTAPAKEHEVYNELLKVKEVVELHPLFGEYDLIAKIEADDFNLLGQVVVDAIRSIPGVIDTKTLTGIKF
jgi:DNA-binding Lrp family transcriptional regulator